ncbi:MAG: hypothetical protein N2691_00190 [Patescibacteria group bacterium]|nr:hypothetical protein [Patescibacteria group bacterium]
MQDENTSTKTSLRDINLQVPSATLLGQTDTAPRQTDTPPEEPQNGGVPMINQQQNQPEVTPAEVSLSEVDPDELALTDNSPETTPEENSSNPDRDKALSIMQVEDLINRQMADIEKMRDEVKLLKSSYEDIFKNDAKYRELDEKVKESTKLKKQYMRAMSKDPSVTKAAEDYQRKREELKDLQIGLSDYLREYNRVSGLSQFETQDGRLLEIVQVFKLVKK